MPATQDLERQARRRPVGLAIRDICLDLAVIPGFCQSAFWNELFELITCFGSSVGRLMQEKTKSRDALAREQDRNPNWDWLNPSRETLPQTLGVFIGEPPINPLDPVPP